MGTATAKRWRTTEQHRSRSPAIMLEQTAQTLVTHDLAEAAYLGDRIVLMDEGRIVQIGTLQDLRAKPASEFVTEFINAQRGLALV
jgi:osmoprotectant transport system ATP-binding protein